MSQMHSDLSRDEDVQANDDIFQILKRDHRRISEMMELIVNDDGPEDSDTRIRTFQELAMALRAHTKGEEEVFYPRLLGSESTRDLTMEAFQEHRVATNLLNELEGMGVRGETWEAKFRVLKENVEHHVDEEENQLFSKARRVLGDEEEKDIAAAFLAAKQRHTQSLQSPNLGTGAGRSDVNIRSGGASGRGGQ